MGKRSRKRDEAWDVKSIRSGLLAAGNLDPALPVPTRPDWRPLGWVSNEIRVQAIEYFLASFLDVALNLPLTVDERRIIDALAGLIVEDLLRYPEAP